MATTTISRNTTATSATKVGGGDTLKVNGGVTLTYTDTKQAVSWTGTAGTAIVDIAGSISATDPSARGIDANMAPVGGATLNVTVESGGSLLSKDDAIRDKYDFANGTIVVTNSGVIVSGSYNAATKQISGTASGQAIDLSSLTSASTNTTATITNNAGALIGTADADAIKTNIATTINNYGRILAQETGTDTSDGISFSPNSGTVQNGSGTVNNYQGGSITGAHHGIGGKLTGTPLNINNAGTITGQLGSGINIDIPDFSTPAQIAALATVAITNLSTGVITGNAGGATDGDAIDVDDLVHIDNYGQINAFGTSSAGLSEAITIGGGTIDNYAGGVIHSVQRAITVDDSNDGNAYGATTIYNEGDIRGDNGEAISIVDVLADTITNKGSIEGSISTGGGNDTFNAYTGSSTTGTIDGGDGGDTFNLEGSGTGTLHGVTNFETLGVDSGAWTLTDQESFASGVTIAGGASLKLGGGASGLLAGDIILKGRLELASSGAAGNGSITFANGAASTLILDAGARPANTIGGFDTDDTLDLLGFDAATTRSVIDQATDVLSVTDSSGHSIALQLAGNYAGKFFHAASTPGGAALTEDTTPCYARGTSILTDTGEVAVERLAVGDIVVTASGERRPIVWLGSRRVDIARHPRPELVRPVRIAAGALGQGLPMRDLVLSPEHALWLDDALVPAEKLINGATIRQEDWSAVDYFHVELDSHDILLAEGVPAESYLDCDNRASFDNAPDGVVAPHPDWSGLAAIRPIASAAHTSRLRARFAVRAAALGRDAELRAFEARQRVRGQATRTNVVRNPRAEGSVPGRFTADGRAPAHWWFTAPEGIAIEIRPTGGEDGLPFLDLRLVGTSAAGGAVIIEPEPDAAAAATAGQDWTVSCYLRRVGGGATGLAGIKLFFGERDAEGAFLGCRALPQPLPTSDDLAAQRLVATRRMIRPGVAAMTGSLQVEIAPGTPLDVTLRLAGFQIEAGAYASDLILPPRGEMGVSTRQGTPTQALTNRAA